MSIWIQAKQIYYKISLRREPKLQKIQLQINCGKVVVMVTRLHNYCKPTNGMEQSSVLKTNNCSSS